MMFRAVRCREHNNHNEHQIIAIITDLLPLIASLGCDSYIKPSTTCGEGGAPCVALVEECKYAFETYQGILNLTYSCIHLIIYPTTRRDLWILEGSSYGSDALQFCKISFVYAFAGINTKQKTALVHC